MIGKFIRKRDFGKRGEALPMKMVKQKHFLYLYSNTIESKRLKRAIHNINKFAHKPLEKDSQSNISTKSLKK